jgi:1-acyl-sn-glycerol-3-phosphate acyltransferase
MVQRLSYWLSAFFFGGFVDMRVTGREHLPPTGAFVLAPNHASPFDPFLLTLATRRWVDWVAMIELYRHPALAWYWNALGAIPVDRSRLGRKTMATALDRLAAGRVVGIFPERGIRLGGQSALNGGRIDPGACRLAVRAGAPLIPAVILGSENMLQTGGWLFPRRAFRVRVVFGPPLAANPALDARAAAADLCQRLARAFTELAAEGGQL